MARKTLLVAGASGIAGSSIIRHFSALPGWQIFAVSRRPPPGLDPSVKHVSVDLTDRETTLALLSDLPSVECVAYAALHERGDLLQGWREQTQMDTNLAMVRNLLDGLQRGGTRLQHVVTLQGAKAYGSHLHRVPVPAKERWRRGNHEIFYWQQEDFLRERSRDEGWCLTILRPSMILGDSVGSPMSMVAAIGVYAAVMRQLEGALPFPGGEPGVTSATDSRLIARAVEFAVERDGATETFNVVNGDVMLWQDLWPAIANHFDLPVAPQRRISLASEMPKCASTWDEIVDEYALTAGSMTSLVGSAWQYADYAFASDNEAAPISVIMSPIKLRQAGFADCLDTEDSILYWLDRMQQARLLPR